MAGRWVAFGFALLVTGWSGPGSALELRVGVAGAGTSAIRTIVEQFEASSGHRVVLVPDTAQGMVRRMEADETVDVVIASAVVIDLLTAKGLIRVGSRIDLARGGIGIGVPDGVASPDISSLEAVERLLTSGVTIAYPDPASGSASGLYIADLLRRLGLADTLRPKVRLAASGEVVSLVARREADLVLQQMSEILPVTGVTMVGPLPPEIQVTITYSAGIAAAAMEPEAARAFLAFITGPASLPVLANAGLEPPRQP